MIHMLIDDIHVALNAFSTVETDVVDDIAVLVVSDSIGGTPELTRPKEKRLQRTR